MDSWYCRKFPVLNVCLYFYQIKKKKNVTKDGLGTTHGRIHIQKQQIDKIQTRKMKGLKKTIAERKEERAALQKRRADQAASGITSKRLRAELWSVII